MPTLTVIFLLLMHHYEISYGFRMFKFARSVDTRQFPEFKVDIREFPSDTRQFGNAGDSQNYWQSPCPNMFQYRNDPSGNLIGVVRVDQNDPSGKIQLDIELSVGNAVQGYNGKIILAEEKQKVINDVMNRKPIYYNVLFPAWQNIPPRITKILINGNLICSGPPVPIQLVPVLTKIDLQHKLSVTPLSLSDDFDSNSFNNLGPNSFNTQGSQYIFDVRVDTPRPFSKPNHVFSDGSNNPFVNVNNNPYNFNPVPPEQQPTPPPNSRPQPGGDSPPPNRRPPPEQGHINPQNPFLNPGFNSESGKGDGGSQTNNNNPFFFNQRTESPPAVVQSTKTPSRGGGPSGSVSGNINEICGRPLTTNSLIVNGQSVPRGAYPWLVAIFRQLENLSVSYICSGSLISERHVVTAAHCVKLEYRRVKPTEIVCIFGKLNIRKWVTAPGEKMLEPESIVIHPDYETGKANADIAVMAFQEPISFSKTIMPVCLWRTNNDLNAVVGNIGTVVGWGRDEYGESTAEPRQVKMPIVNTVECLTGSSSTAGQALVDIVSKNTFCAGFRNGSGPCNGDSGSAFLLRVNGVFYLRGIVSTALSEATHRSCNLKEYVVFTDASKYVDWLTNIMGQS